MRVRCASACRALRRFRRPLDLQRTRAYARGMEEITVIARDLRTRISDYIDTAMDGTPVHVTRHRRPAVVIVSADWYAQALRAMSVCDAMAPRNAAE